MTMIILNKDKIFIYQTNKYNLNSVDNTLPNTNYKYIFIRIS